MSKSVVFMGVAGCGKSTVAIKVAQILNMTLIEGDEHHSLANVEKMGKGIALTDEDRDSWLSSLCELLNEERDGVFLTCSALKKKYRDRLREASPNLLFVFLELSKESAQRRVSNRASHFFSTTLVDSQFETLEPPLDEPGVYRIDATLDLDLLANKITSWLASHN